MSSQARRLLHNCPGQSAESIIWANTGEFFTNRILEVTHRQTCTWAGRMHSSIQPSHLPLHLLCVRLTQVNWRKAGTRAIRVAHICKWRRTWWWRRCRQGQGTCKYGHTRARARAAKVADTFIKRRQQEKNFVCEFSSLLVKPASSGQASDYRF